MTPVAKKEVEKNLAKFELTSVVPDEIIFREEYEQN